MSWINHLPLVCWSTFWKSTFKQLLGCGFDIMDYKSSFFCILTNAIVYVLIHHMLFRLYLYFLNSVPQGWVSSGRNLFLPGHPEKSGRNLFLPVLSGQNWKKLDKTGRAQNCWKKIIIILNYLQKIIMIMVTNAFGKLVLSKTMMRKINYFWPISSKTGRNWMTIGETLKFVRNAEKKLIIMLIFSQKVMVTNAWSWLQLFRNLI